MRHTKQVTTAALALMLMLLAAPAIALSPEKPVTGQAVITKVIDGDTFDLAVMKWETFDRIERNAPHKASQHLDSLNKIMRVRLNGVDTAELGTAEGDAIASTMRQRIAGDAVGFRCFDFGYYGRVICHVEHQGQDIGAWLLENGHSKYISQYGKDPFLHRYYSQFD